MRQLADKRTSSWQSCQTNGNKAIFAGGVFVMYARHFFHLKQIQMRHTLLFGPIFVGAAIIALFLFLLNMTQPASEEQLKSAFLLVQIGILFLMIWCQILDLFVFFDTGAREITKGFHFRIFLWDITSFAIMVKQIAAALAIEIFVLAKVKNTIRIQRS